jgi:hypothetical protein
MYDALTARVAEEINIVFGDEIDDDFFTPIVDMIADAIATTTTRVMAEALASDD